MKRTNTNDSKHPVAVTMNSYATKKAHSCALYRQHSLSLSSLSSSLPQKYTKRTPSNMMRRFFVCVFYYVHVNVCICMICMCFKAFASHVNNILSAGKDKKHNTTSTNLSDENNARLTQNASVALYAIKHRNDGRKGVFVCYYCCCCCLLLRTYLTDWEMLGGCSIFVWFWLVVGLGWHVAMVYDCYRFTHRMGDCQNYPESPYWPKRRAVRGERKEPPCCFLVGLFNAVRVLFVVKNRMICWLIMKSGLVLKRTSCQLYHRNVSFYHVNKCTNLCCDCTDVVLLFFSQKS